MSKKLSSFIKWITLHRGVAYRQAIYYANILVLSGTAASALFGLFAYTLEIPGALRIELQVEGEQVNIFPLLCIGILTYSLLSLARLLGGYRFMLEFHLERRDFSLQLEDVQEAFATLFAYDREGVFTLPGEYDAIRERIRAARNHPDLLQMNGEVLEVAAELSYVLRDLAATYSTERVKDARDAIKTAHQRVAELEERVKIIKAVEEEVRREVVPLEMDKSIAESELRRSCHGIADILGRIDPKLANAILTHCNNVVAFRPQTD